MPPIKNLSLQRCSKNQLATKSIIRSFGTSLLVLVFAFSILPKKTVHDLFATHKDSSFSFNDSKDQQISWAGFHCNCENLVVESPFIDNHLPTMMEILPDHSIQYVEHFTVYHKQYIGFTALRGPPAIRI